MFLCKHTLLFPSWDHSLLMGLESLVLFTQNPRCCYEGLTLSQTDTPTRQFLTVYMVCMRETETDRDGQRKILGN